MYSCCIAVVTPLVPQRRYFEPPCQYMCQYICVILYKILLVKDVFSVMVKQS